MKVILTGGSQGIGAAIYDHLKSNHQVNTFSRSSGIDIACPSQVADWYRSIGPVDVLINNAAIYARGSITETSLEDWDYMMKVNLYGPFQLMNLVLPGMIAQNYGRIINFVSAIVTTPLSGRAAYATSKAALIALTRFSAAETSQYNIKINGICPGLVSTRMDVDRKAKRRPESVLPTVDMLMNLDESGPTGLFFRDLKQITL